MTTKNTAPDLIERRAPVASSTWNAETRTFEVVFSTGAAVPRFDMRGPYIEVLAIDGFRDAEGAPFLDAHRRDSLDDVLGAVQSARVVGGEARAIVKLSRRNPKAERLAGELEDGSRFGVSVGYTVDEWKETTDTKTGARTKTALHWTVHEISAVPVPADRLASTRNDNSMPTTAATTPENAPGTPDTVPATPETAATERAAVTTENRADINQQIRAMAQPLGLERTWVDQQIDAGRTVEDARRSALDEMIRRGQQGSVQSHRIEIGNDYTDPDFRARTLGEALYARINRAHNPGEAAREYASLSIADMARDCLRLRGVASTGLTPGKLMERALHSTSDFPLILGDATGRTMRESYRVAGSALKMIGRQVNHSDFRERHRLQLSEGPELEKVGESGEIKAGTLAEARETYKLATYAKRVGISRQILVNDDLGAFADIGRRMGQGAAGTEASLLVALLTQNSGAGPKMSDGKALFHADHANLGAGYTPWETAEPGFVSALSAARLAMRRQVGLQGQPIAITPKYLVVPSEGETDGEKALADITAASVADANPFASKLQLIVEPRLVDPLAWYVAADTAEVDGLEWSYLEGEEGPQIDTRSGWEIEGLEVKVRLDFGAGFVDWRGWHRNPGDA